MPTCSTVIKSVCSKVKCQIDGSRPFMIIPVASKCQKLSKRLVQPDSEPENKSESKSENKLDTEKEMESDDKKPHRELVTETLLKET